MLRFGPSDKLCATFSWLVYPRSTFSALKRGVIWAKGRNRLGHSAGCIQFIGILLDIRCLYLNVKIQVALRRWTVWPY